MSWRQDVLYLEACRIFISEYWERSGKPIGDLSDCLSYFNGEGSTTSDPAAWQDWLNSIEKARHIKKKNWLND